MILVSHDRYLLEACADRLWLVQGGKVTPFDGDLDDYRRLVLSDAARNVAGTSASQSAARPDRAQARTAAADKRAETAPLRKRVQKAEAEIARLTREIAKAGRDAGGRRPVRARSGASAAELVQDARRKPRPRSPQAEEEWLAASARLETA